MAVCSYRYSQLISTYNFNLHGRAGTFASYYYSLNGVWYTGIPIKILRICQEEPIFSSWPSIVSLSTTVFFHFEGKKRVPYPLKNEFSIFSADTVYIYILYTLAVSPSCGG